MAESPDWTIVFPPGPFRFHVGLRPGNPVRFFRSTPDHASLVGERARWLAQEAETYAALEPEAEPLLEETVDLAFAWNSLRREEVGALGAARQRSGLQAGLTLGRVWEPDFLLMAETPGGAFRLVGGVVCFPSSWALRDKLGLSMGEIHFAVPGLNPMLGRQIDMLLSRMAPGGAWERENWGLSADAELNRHPRRDLGRLGPGTPLKKIWIRLERQILVRLTTTRGLLFGIRVSVHRLRDLLEHPAASANFVRALETMPEDVAAYKGLAEIRPSLLTALRSAAAGSA